jgi:hypothetical protein
MRANLRDWHEPTPGEMVARYHALMTIPDWHRDLPRPDSPPSAAPVAATPPGWLERWRLRLIALHLSTHAGIIGARWLPRKVRRLLLAGYEGLAAMPHVLLRSVFALLQGGRNRR